MFLLCGTLPAGQLLYPFGALLFLTCALLCRLRPTNLLGHSHKTQCLPAVPSTLQANNPFVVRFYYSFSSPEKLFLVMEYCNGGDLASMLQVRQGCAL
jgi:hypothetical protein